MKIKKVNIVSEEDIKGLLRALELSIKDIIEGRENDALWTLKRLKGSIEANLKEDI